MERGDPPADPPAGFKGSARVPVRASATIIVMGGGTDRDDDVPPDDGLSDGWPVVNWRGGVKAWKV